MEIGKHNSKRNKSRKSIKKLENNKKTSRIEMEEQPNDKILQRNVDKGQRNGYKVEQVGPNIQNWIQFSKKHRSWRKIPTRSVEFRRLLTNARSIQGVYKEPCTYGIEISWCKDYRH